MPDSLDAFLAITSYYRLIAPGFEPRASSADFCHAYKNIGTPCGGWKFAPSLLGPPAGPLLFSQLRTQPFGSTRAPAKWGRVTPLIQWALLTFFGIRLSIYVGDCLMIEPAATVGSAYLCAKLSIKLFGFDLGKFSPPAPTIRP